MLLRDELRHFVTDNFMFGKPYKGFADDDSFIERGIIDSTAVMELVAFLEKHYRIKLLDEDLIPDNLDSINCLARFVIQVDPFLEPIAIWSPGKTALACNGRRPLLRN